MSRLTLYIISILTLVATVPWFFSEEMDVQVFGFPPWAFYSICMTVLYAVVISVIIYRYWHVLAGDDDEE
ncbi:MAG: hypothetical protein ACE5KZ_03720 [Candidatus Scalinduaceae bacterium]